MYIICRASNFIYYNILRYIHTSYIKLHDADAQTQLSKKLIHSNSVSPYPHPDHATPPPDHSASKRELSFNMHDKEIIFRAVLKNSTV